MNWIFDLLAATLRSATPLVYGTIGETIAERAGVLDLGIEGTMYAGAFSGFAAAYLSGSLYVGLAVAIVVGMLAGTVMGVLTVTLGANQHVSGLGLTITLVGLSEFANRLLFTGTGSALKHIEPFGTWNPLSGLGEVGTIFDQYGLTWLGFLVIAPAAWWLLGRTRLGLAIRAVGENPEAADAAGINVARVRYLALIVGQRPHVRGRRLPDPGRAGQLHPRHRGRPRLGLHRAGHLRPLAYLARRRRRVHLRRGVRAGAAAAHPARRRHPAAGVCCWRCRTWRSSPRWPSRDATSTTRAHTSSRIEGAETWTNRRRSSGLSTSVSLR